MFFNLFFDSVRSRFLFSDSPQGCFIQTPSVAENLARRHPVTSRGWATLSTPALFRMVRYILFVVFLCTCPSTSRGWGLGVSLVSWLLLFLFLLESNRIFYFFWLDQRRDDCMVMWETCQNQKEEIWLMKGMFARKRYQHPQQLHESAELEKLE